MRTVFKKRLTPRKLANGPHPSEKLPRHSVAQALLADTAPPCTLQLPAEAERSSDYSITRTLSEFIGVFASLRLGAVSDAAIPDALRPEQAREQLKAFGFFLGADLIGSAHMAPSRKGTLINHRAVLVIAVGFKNSRPPNSVGQLWQQGSQQARADAKAAEIAVVLANFLRTQGIPASSHMAGAAEINLKRAALAAGIATEQQHTLSHPLLKQGFGLAAISTPLLIASDLPLLPRADSHPMQRQWQALSQRVTHMLLQLLGKRQSLRQRAVQPVDPQDDQQVDSQASTDTNANTHPLETPYAPVALNPSHLKRCPLPASLPESRRLSALGEQAPYEQKALRMLTRKVMKMPPPQVMQGTPPQAFNAQQNRQAMHTLAHYLGADQVGFAALEPRHWRPSKHIPLNPPQHVLLMLVHDKRAHWASEQTPSMWQPLEQEAALLNSTILAQQVSYHLATLGFSARFHTGLRAELQLYPLLAEAGLLVFDEASSQWKHPQFGSDFQVSAVATNLPLIEKATPSSNSDNSPPLRTPDKKKHPKM